MDVADYLKFIRKFFPPINSRMLEIHYPEHFVVEIFGRHQRPGHLIPKHHSGVFAISCDYVPLVDYLAFSVGKAGELTEGVGVNTFKVEPLFERGYTWSPSVRY